MTTPFLADLHIHSRHSLATSREADLPHLALWAGKKGITVVGTGDLTHPVWRERIREELLPAEPGLFRLRPELESFARQEAPPGAPEVRFLLTAETNSIYRHDGRTRKIHSILLFPDFAAADAFAARVTPYGKLASDGRPILALDVRDLLEMLLSCDPRAFLVPAHVWTPWFSLLGSKSGFDSVEACFRDLSGEVFALETGLSSDPAMNRRLSRLDRFALISNSDAHSPAKLGREATRFTCAMDFFAMRRALETRQGLAGTIEFFPEEGKYHLDGHRACGVRMHPADSRARRDLCPVCGKGMTLGVSHRVEELADRRVEEAPSEPFTSLVPLPEILAESLGTSPTSKKVQQAYLRLLTALGPEIPLLSEAPLEEIARAGSLRLAEGIARMRTGRVVKEGGYDGEFGRIRVF